MYRDWMTREAYGLKVWFYKKFMGRHPALTRVKAEDIKSKGGDPKANWGMKFDPMGAEPVDIGFQGLGLGTDFDDYHEDDPNQQEELSEMDAAALAKLGAEVEVQDVDADTETPTTKTN